ncbi:MULTISPECIES: hypothetical protein [unclassified Carboxylicivirga]|uniref:hypothetical protein n=1 Tax=Carboxylicivirga TaxID=1628153 RepID=UPI003D345589
MKYTFNLIVIALMMSFAGCSSDEEQAGEIPGMGTAEGVLQVVEDYQAPEGFVIGDGIGVNYGSSNAGVKSYVPSTAALKSGSGWFNSYGSGRFIKIKLTITNVKDYGRCCWLPRGLVFEVSDPAYQHGMLMCWTPIWLRANQTRDIILEVFCINRGRSGSDTSVTYKVKGVTSSPVMKRFFQRLGWRKINKEFYYGTSAHQYELKAMAAEDLAKYDEISENLQEALWTLTDGDGDLTQEQIDYINSIPLMPEGTYPAYLDDEGAIPPEDWQEYPMGYSGN